MSSVKTSKRIDAAADASSARLRMWAYIIVGDEGGHVADPARSSRKRLVA